MNPGFEDPVITEIRAVREELSRRFGGDIDALCDFLAEKEREHEQRLVNRPPNVPQYAHVAEACGK
jgi:hypothetical protein